jgi:preprotein translocase subunit YajC
MHELTWTLTQLLVAQAEGGDGGGGFADFLRSPSTMLLVMIAAVYFIMMRPMLRQNKQQQALLKALKKDDEVVTSGGIYGRIVQIDERTVVLEISKGTTMKVLRSSIAGKWNPAAPQATAAPAKE